MKKTTVAFLAGAVAIVAAAQDLNIREFDRIVDPRQTTLLDSLEWYAGESVSYVITARRGETPVEIPEGTIQIWTVLDAQTNAYVVSTGQVVSATNGVVSFWLPAPLSNIPAGAYVSWVQSYQGTNRLGVLDKANLTVKWRPQDDYNAQPPISNIFDVVLGYWASANGNLAAASNALALAVSDETAARIGADLGISNAFALADSAIAARIGATETNLALASNSLALAISAEESARIAAILPLATTSALAAAVAPLASTNALAAAIAPLATTQGLAQAIAPLASTQALAAAVAPLASTGYVAAAIAGISIPETNGFATTQALAAAIAGLDIPETNGLASTSYVATAVSGRATTQALAAAVSGLASTSFVSSAIQTAGAGYLAKTGGVVSGDITISGRSIEVSGGGASTGLKLGPIDSDSADSQPVIFNTLDGDQIADVQKLYADWNGYLRRNHSGNDWMLWDEGTDGPGSGLDADTLDGIHAAGFSTTGATAAAIAGRASTQALAIVSNMVPTTNGLASTGYVAAAIAPLASTSSLAAAVAPLVTTSALSATLAGYSTTGATAAILSGYSTTGATAAAIAPLVSTSGLATTLSGYSTTGATAAAIAPLVSTSGLATTLAGYVATNAATYTDTVSKAANALPVLSSPALEYVQIGAASNDWGALFLGNPSKTNFWRMVVFSNRVFEVTDTGGYVPLFEMATHTNPATWLGKISVYASNTLVFNVSTGGTASAKAFQRVSGGVTSGVAVSVALNGETNAADSEGLIDLGTLEIPETNSLASTSYVAAAVATRASTSDFATLVSNVAAISNSVPTTNGLASTSYVAGAVSDFATNLVLLSNSLAASVAASSGLASTNLAIASNYFAESMATASSNYSTSTGEFFQAIAGQELTIANVSNELRNGIGVAQTNLDALAAASVALVETNGYWSFNHATGAEFVRFDSGTSTPRELSFSNGIISGPWTFDTMPGGIELPAFSNVFAGAGTTGAVASADADTNGFLYFTGEWLPVVQDGDTLATGLSGPDATETNGYITKAQFDARTNAAPRPGNTTLTLDAQSNLWITGETYYFTAAPTNPFTVKITNGCPAVGLCLYDFSSNACTLDTNMTLLGTWTPSRTNVVVFTPMTNGAAVGWFVQPVAK